MQYLDEALCLFHVVENRSLGDLETDHRRRYSGTVESLDDKTEERIVGNSLSGQIDGTAAVPRDFQFATGECNQRGVDDPAIDLWHQLVTLCGSEEVRRIGLAAAAGQPDKHFHGRPGIRAAVHGDNRLHGELERVVMQRGLKFAQPANVAALPRDCLVPRRVDMDLAPPFLLGHIAGRVGGAHHVLNGAADVADLDQADRYADIEDLVFPDETVVGNRIADIRCDLPRLVDRAADQQRAEFIAAESPDEVRITHLVLDEGGDFAEHVVPRQVAATVVNGLEAIEVHVEQHVHRLLGVCGVHRLVEAAFEFAPVDQSRQWIVSRLVTHPPCEATQLADVMEHDDGPGDAVARAANGRRRQFDRMFLLAVLGHHDRPPSHVDAAAHREAPVHGVSERTPVGVIHERE